MESTLYGERKRDFQKRVFFFFNIYVRGNTEMIKKKGGKVPYMGEQDITKTSLYSVFELLTYQKR